VVTVTSPRPLLPRKPCVPALTQSLPTRSKPVTINVACQVGPEAAGEVAGRPGGGQPATIPEVALKLDRPRAAEGKGKDDLGPMSEADRSYGKTENSTGRNGVWSSSPGRKMPQHQRAAHAGLNGNNLPLKHRSHGTPATGLPVGAGSGDSIPATGLPLPTETPPEVNVKANFVEPRPEQLQFRLDSIII